MKRHRLVYVAFMFTVVLFLGSALDISAQLLINEIEADPGDQTNDSCQYIELRGTPGAIVAANTYFVAIDSDAAFPGSLNHVVNVSGAVVGSNGLIYLNNTFGTSPCPNRTPAAGTTIVNYSSPVRIGGLNLTIGSESFAIIQTAANIFSGLDGDVADDGVLDFSIIGVLDSVAFIVNPDEHFVYPDQNAPFPTTPVLGTPFQDVPDALTRFPSNSTAFSAAAYYWGEVSSLPTESTVYEAPLSANFPPGGLLTPGAPNFPFAAVGSARADFDGDGRTDLSVFRGSEGIWYANRSSLGFSAIRFGLAGDRLVPGDYDGDNKTDAAIFRPGAADSDPDYWVLNSNGFTVSALAWGAPNDIPLNGDYDGDGKTDFAVFRPSTGQWFIRQSNGGTVAIFDFGLAGDVPLVMNHDGDARTNLSVFRPSTGVWYLARSTGTPGTNFDAVPFGLATDRLVPADYDGDDKDDIAVFRPSNGLWYILRSTNGNVDFIPFGLGTDIPVPGDYDGDNRDDIAVYRNGTWYLRQSTAGIGYGQFGIASDSAVPASYLP